MQRYTFFFTNYTQGWSETLFRPAPFGPTENVFMDQYITNRLSLLATGCTLVSIRGSNLDTKRDIVIYPLPNAGRSGSWVYGGGGGSGDAGLPTDTEDSFTALLLRLSTGAAQYRSFPLLGLPDHIIQGSVVVPSEQALLNSRLNNWMQAITQAGFGMKSQGVPTVAGRIVEFPDKTNDNQLVCLGLKGPIPTVGSIVILGAVKPWSRLNRQWRVAGVAGPAAGVDGYIYLSGTSDMNTYGPVEGGTYKVPNYGFGALQNYTISRVTARKTGVPFTTVRGRRSGIRR